MIPAHFLLPVLQSAYSPHRVFDKYWLSPYSAGSCALRRTNKMRISDSQTWRTKYGCWEEGIVREFGMDVDALLYLKMDHFCLENPRDGGAWRASIYGVAQSPTRLKRFSSSSSSNQQGPMFSTGNSAQCGSLDGRAFGGEWIHVYVWLSPVAVYLKLSCIGYTPIQNKKVKKKRELAATRSLETDVSPHQLLQGRATLHDIQQRGGP